MQIMKYYLHILMILFWCGQASAARVHAERETDRAPLGLLSFFNTKDSIIAYGFHASNSSIMIIDEGDNTPRYGNLNSALQKNFCVAGVNGGFYADDAHNSPMGLLISNGTLISPLSHQGFTAAGVLYVVAGELKLERRQHLSTDLNKMQQAVQSGPFLVENRKVVPGLNNRARDKRTFVATDGQGNWIIGISSALTLHELAVWLSTSPRSLGIEIKYALNLDGGSSTTFFDRESGDYQPSGKRVRNYIGIYHKKPKQRF